MKLSPDVALALLDECTGDDLWSVEHCLERRVPQSWIDELADAFETSYRVSSQTIYVPDPQTGRRIVNQYYGVRDVDLAKRIATDLGLDVESIEAACLSRQAIVRMIKEAIMDG
ncbi:hypothetical protein [Rhodopirellula sp. SWK7]|uniref:hypothetical protein n=1 Tax=Rhodopirellula sp. SWK7 TaxID=595460 RepID=UPI0002BEE50A|nr:hypothetical protein [Rhodopirellula sp. SWK7]EMI41434.1 hypothetical protein RRSWK_06029 [Rhodopirellula sp. SWK7]